MNAKVTNIISTYLKNRPVNKAWMFGSFSRNEETKDSDVDILVEFDSNAKVSLIDHATMICDLEDKLGRKVDLVKQGTLMPFAVPSVETDKILIYERGR